MPRSAAIETTSRFVDVPMVVAMPPIRTAALSGISVFEAAMAPRSARPTKTGSNRTSTGVSLTIIDRIIARSSETSMPRCLLSFQTVARRRVAGSSAPVTTRPRPMTIKAQIVISAGCPKPEKASVRPCVALSPSNGKKNSPSAIRTIVTRLTISVAIRPRANAMNIARVRTIAPSA